MIKKIIAEYLGTFFLAFMGTGAIMISYLMDSLNNFEISMIFGITVTLLIFIYASTSGAHLNPAVSVCFCIRKDINLKQLCFYIIGQISGSLTASTTLLLLFGNVANLGSAIPCGPVD